MNYKVIIIDNATGREAYSADVTASSPRESVGMLATRLEANPASGPIPVVRPDWIYGPDKPKHAKPDWLYSPNVRQSGDSLTAVTETIESVVQSYTDDVCDTMLAQALSTPVLPKRKSRHRKVK